METLEIDALQHALELEIGFLVHEILRTVIVLEDGERLPVPRVLSLRAYVQLSTLDLRDTSANLGVKARDFVSAVANTRLFDLSRDIMLRADSYTLNPAKTCWFS